MLTLVKSTENFRQLNFFAESVRPTAMQCSKNSKHTIDIECQLKNILGII